jgi:hypothetical protein
MNKLEEFKDDNRIIYTANWLKLNNIINNISNLKSQSVGLLITKKTLDDSGLFLLPIVQNTKIGFIDLAGVVVIKPVYDSVKGDFINENSIVVIELNKVFGAINCRGEVIVSCEYMRIDSFNDGIALARNFNYQYGFIDTQNKVLVEFGRFDWSESFVNGLARVILRKEEKKKWGIINPRGEFVLEAKYDEIRRFNVNTSSISAIQNGEYEIINLDLLRI